MIASWASPAPSPRKSWLTSWTLVIARLHPVAIDERPPLKSAIAADENIRPDCGPVAGVVFRVGAVVQNLADELGFPVRFLAGQKLAELGDGWYAPQHVQINSAAPLAVRCCRRWTQLVVLPHATNLF